MGKLDIIMRHVETFQDDLRPEVFGEMVRLFYKVKGKQLMRDSRRL